MRDNDNEIIAEFMDIPVRFWGPVLYKSDEDGYVDIAGDAEPYWPHLSWSQLMAVVEKITKIPYESEEVDNGFGVKVTVVQRPYLRTFGMINDENGHYMARFNRCALHMAPTLIEATYSAVVEFIKSHNANEQLRRISSQS